MENSKSKQWPKIPLGEVTEEIRDRVNHSGGDGLTVYGVERQDDFMVTPKYSAEDLTRYKKIKPGDFAYNPMRLNIGSIGMCGFHQDPGLISPDYIGFRCIDNKLDPSFLRHVIKGPEWISWAESAGVGSVRQRIYYKEIARLVLTIPPFEEQKAVAKTLDSIDTLIDLNTRTNEILEEMSRTLFRSWFVDFDPVRAKAEGRQPEGMDAETAALFPSELVESELGMIPKGWEVKSLSQIIDLVYGKTLKSNERTGGDIPVFGSNGIIGYHSHALVKGPGIIIGRKGTAGSVIRSMHDFFPIDTTFFVSKTRDIPWEYLLNVLLLINLPNLSADSAVPGLNRAAALSRLVLLPDKKILGVFDNIASSLIEKTVSKSKEIALLQKLKDELLPRLISREIRLPEDMIAEFEVNA